jgi:bacillithiol synthase
MIPFDQLPGLHPLFVDYMADRIDNPALYPGTVWDFDHWLSCIEAARQAQVNRPELCNVLRAYNTALGNDAAAMENIDRLGENGTIAVVTGQQAGLLTGPLYTLYKAMTAIRLADFITRKWQQPAVPVFWVETGDHDFAEIASVHLMNADGTPNTATCSPAEPNLPVPVAELTVDNAVRACLDQAAGSLAQSDFQPQIADQIQRTYPYGGSLSVGFGTLLAQLLRGSGLVLIDPSDPGVKSLSRPFYRDVIEKRAALHEALVQQTDAVRQAGYTPQVTIPERTSHLFYRGPEGRVRIDEQDGIFTLGAERCSASELLEIVDTETEKISPSVLTRPLLQDTLLPTAMTVVGPGETAYMAQLLHAYELLGRPMPAPAPRMSVTLVERPVQRILEKRGLSIQTVLNEKDGGLARLLRAGQNLPVGDRMQEAGKTVDSLFAQLETLARDVDVTLVDAVANAGKKVRYQVENLEQKMMRALERRESTLVQQTQRCRAALCPDDHLQERYVNIFAYIAKYGPDVVERIAKQLDPFARGHQVIEL